MRYNLRFTSASNYIDTETGELIDKTDVTKGDYIIVGTEKQFNYETKQQIYVRHCKRSRQLRIF